MNPLVVATVRTDTTSGSDIRLARSADTFVPLQLRSYCHLHRLSMDRYHTYDDLRLFSSEFQVLVASRSKPALLLI
jgi:uncharacterized membrane protein (UPF0182 family)